MPVAPDMFPPRSPCTYRRAVFLRPPSLRSLDSDTCRWVGLSVAPVSLHTVVAIGRLSRCSIERTSACQPSPLPLIVPQSFLASRTKVAPAYSSSRVVWHIPLVTSQIRRPSVADKRLRCRAGVNHLSCRCHSRPCDYEPICCLSALGHTTSDRHLEHSSLCDC